MSVHLSEADAVAAAAPHVVYGSSYRISTILSGKAVRWNPCAAIHWQFRTADAPSWGLTLTRQAVARIAQVTGTRWVYDGAVSTAPSSAWLPHSPGGARPVLIGWTDGAHSDLLRGRASTVLAVTRTAWFGVVRNGVTTAAIKAAVIALDRSDRLPVTGGASWKAVLLHELGHAMGLDHAGSSAQLMYPVLQRNLPDLQSGDLLGLSKVGARLGCVNI